MSEQKDRPGVTDIIYNALKEIEIEGGIKLSDRAFIADHLAPKLIALFPDREEVKVAWIKALMKEGILVAEPKDLAGIGNKLIEEAKREGRERIYKWGNEDCPHNHTVKLKVKRGCIACWQALRGD